MKKTPIIRILTDWNGTDQKKKSYLEALEEYNAERDDRKERILVWKNINRDSSGNVYAGFFSPEQPEIITINNSILNMNPGVAIDTITHEGKHADIYDYFFSQIKNKSLQLFSNVSKDKFFNYSLTKIWFYTILKSLELSDEQAAIITNRFEERIVRNETLFNIVDMLIKSYENSGDTKYLEQVIFGYFVPMFISNEQKLSLNNTLFRDIETIEDVADFSLKVATNYDYSDITTLRDPKLFEFLTRNQPNFAKCYKHLNRGKYPINVSSLPKSAYTPVQHEFQELLK